jgi:hypothetical protein
LFSSGLGSTGDRRNPADRAKPFEIPKREVWAAYKSVRANQGAAGVDGQSIADFEADLSNNLYKLWNRLASGSYFPPPVRRVDIPKDDGRTRPLGIPTVADRVAQMVVKRALEPLVEPHFKTIHTGIDPANRRSMQSVWRGSAAGATTGCSIWTSNPFSTKSTAIC